MTLFDNAISSIRIGVEDLVANDDDRLLSAMRNIHAGILLLAKEALRRISPTDEILLAQRFEPQKGPNGEVKIVAVGKLTVGPDDIKKRFKEFGLTLDWKRLDAMTEIRNHMEHRYYDGPKSTAREAVADAFVLISHLLDKELKEDQREALGDECWEALLENNATFEAEQAECRRILAAVDWTTEAARLSLEDIVCVQCSSSLMRQKNPDNTVQSEVEFLCSACGHSAEIGRVLEKAFETAFAADNYIAMTDGGEPPIDTCPECGHETYVREERQCAACDFGVPEDAFCAICGQSLSAEEHYEYNGICSYHANQAMKDD